MKLPKRLFAIAILAIAVLFAASMSPPVYAESISDTQAHADKSGTVMPTTVDVNTVAPIDCQARADWVRESVGMLVLNATVRHFEPTKELAGYRTVIERPKIATYSVTQRPRITAYAGWGNTRAREQV